MSDSNSFLYGLAAGSLAATGIGAAAIHFTNRGIIERGSRDLTFAELISTDISVESRESLGKIIEEFSELKNNPEYGKNNQTGKILNERVEKLNQQAKSILGHDEFRAR